MLSDYLQTESHYILIGSLNLSFAVKPNAQACADPIARLGGK
jgi:hypothetical protein